MKKMDILDKALALVCIKDLKGRILFQNNACQIFCGKLSKVNTQCKTTCLSRYIPDEGTHTYLAQEINSTSFDMIFINDKKTLVSALFPLKRKNDAEFKYFVQFNLTSREKEIITLIIRKFTNQRICEILKLQKSTLKTHLQNIYRKIPPDGRYRLRASYNISSCEL